MHNLDVSSLQFEDIKKNLKEFLKGQGGIYKDFNFEASGISTLVNILAYQTHYIGYFVKMLLDEAFVDSAHTREALLSHAKRVGYIPRNRKAAQAEVILRVNTTIQDEPLSRYLMVERGMNFSAANNAQDTRTFVVTEGTTLTHRTVDGNSVTYTSSPITIHEGVLKEWKFLVDTTINNQKFIIRDVNCDVDTIRVRVKENAQATQVTEFKLAKGIESLRTDSNVFFVTTNENGFYQIFFGNGIFGVQPGNGNAIEVTYVSSGGESGNGAKTFQFNQPHGWAYSDFDVETVATSQGGSEPQTADELRFAIPNHYRRQNRLVTEEDFRSIVLDEFRNIETINVWGGEKNHRREYGRIFMSIKPKAADRLTSQAKETIREKIIKPRSVVGTEVVFVDPEFTNIHLDLRVRLDLRKTSLSHNEVLNLIRERVQEYNRTKVGKFDIRLSDVDLMSYIRAGDASISSVYSTKTLEKITQYTRRSTSKHTVLFGNTIIPGSVTSEPIRYGTHQVTLYDDGGILKLRGIGKVLDVGTVNYTNGEIIYSLPDYIDTYSVTFRASPTRPDVDSFLNNIVRITETQVTVE